MNGMFEGWGAFAQKVVNISFGVQDEFIEERLYNWWFAFWKWWANLNDKGWVVFFDCGWQRIWWQVCGVIDGDNLFFQERSDWTPAAMMKKKILFWNDNSQLGDIKCKWLDCKSAAQQMSVICLWKNGLTKAVPTNWWRRIGIEFLMHTCGCGQAP